MYFSPVRRLPGRKAGPFAGIFANELANPMIDMNQHPRTAGAGRFVVAVICRDWGLDDMVELKIALMVVMIGLLFFAIYFTAIPD